MKASEIRKGQTIKVDGKLYSIVDYQHVKLGKGGAVYQTKIKSLSDGLIQNIRLRSIGRALFGPDPGTRDQGEQNGRSDRTHFLHVFDPFPSPTIIDDSSTTMSHTRSPVPAQDRSRTSDMPVRLHLMSNHRQP